MAPIASRLSSEKNEGPLLSVEAPLPVEQWLKLGEFDESAQDTLAGFGKKCSGMLGVCTCGILTGLLVA